jgi:hypothetical protein
MAKWICSMCNKTCENLSELIRHKDNAHHLEPQTTVESLREYDTQRVKYNHEKN